MNFSGEVRLGIVIVLHFCPGKSLDKNANAAVRELQHAHDHRHGAELVKLVGLGIVGVGRFLRNQQNHPVIVGKGLINCLCGLVAVHEQRNNHVWKHNDVGQRQYRKRVWDSDLLFFRALFGLDQFHAHN